MSSIYLIYFIQALKIFIDYDYNPVLLRNQMFLRVLSLAAVTAFVESAVIIIAITDSSQRIILNSFLNHFRSYCICLDNLQSF